MRLLNTALPVLTLAGAHLLPMTGAFSTKTAITAAAITTTPPAARISLETMQKDILTVTAAAPSSTHSPKTTTPIRYHTGWIFFGYIFAAIIIPTAIGLLICALVWKYRNKLFRQWMKPKPEDHATESHLVESQYAPKPADDKSEGTPPPESYSLDPKERSVSLPRLAVSGSMHFDANKFSGDEIRPVVLRSHGPALVMPKLMEAPPTPPRSLAEMPLSNHSDSNKSTNDDEIHPVGSKTNGPALTMPPIPDAAPTPHPSPIELPCSEALRRASQDTTPTKQQQEQSHSMDSPLPASLLPGRPRSGNWPLMAEVLETINTTPAACNPSLSKHPMTALASPGYTPSQYEPSPPPSNQSRAPRPMSLPQAYSASAFPGTPHIVSESEDENTPPKRPMNMQQADSMAFLMPASPSPKPVQGTTTLFTKKSPEDKNRGSMDKNSGSKDKNSGSKDKNRGWMAAPFTLPEKEEQVPRKSSGFVRAYSEILNDSAVALPHGGGVALPRESAVARVDCPLGMGDVWDNVTVGRGGKKELRGTQEAVVKKEPESGSDSEEDLYGVSDEEEESKNTKENATKNNEENETKNDTETKTPELKKEQPSEIPKSPSPSRDYLSEHSEPTPTRFVPGLAKVVEVLEDEKPIVTKRRSSIYKAPAWAYESTGELSALERFSFGGD